MLGFYPLGGAPLGDDGQVARVTGSLAASEAQDVAVIAGRMVFTGVLAATESQDTASASGSVASSTTGAFTASEAQDGAAIAGNVTNPVVVTPIGWVEQTYPQISTMAARPVQRASWQPRPAETW